MPISSRAARFARAGRLLTSPLARIAGGLLLAAAAITPLDAQSAPSSADAWSLDAQYMQLTPPATNRGATPSLGFALGRAVGHVGVDWRAEAGWSRAVRRGTTGQGATLGLSAGVALPGRAASRIVLRPGIALLAGWAESQDSVALYDWRGLEGTDYEGATGTQFSWRTVRGRTTAIGASLGAELRLARSIGLMASVRQWRFGGSAAAANRTMTLAGVGVMAHPRALVQDARRWWSAARAADAEAVR